MRSPPTPLRSRLLEALGYEVQIVEFIDPENTPKNLMIRAVKGKKPLPQEERSRRLAEYDAVCRWLHVSPTLRKPDPGGRVGPFIFWKNLANQLTSRYLCGIIIK